METTILYTNSNNTVALAADILSSGGILAIPTETVYGLAAAMCCPDAIARIFEVKGRPQDNPLILHVSGIEQIDACAENVPMKAYELAQQFWPGPLTMILPKKEGVPDEVTAGLSTVGVRCPDSDITREIIRTCGFPVAAPSANLSGKPSPTTAQHVISDLGGKIEGVVYGEDCRVGVESTIIDLTCDVPRLLRPGGITVRQLEEILGPVEIDPAVTRALGSTETARAPGMKYRHYAPSAPLYIIRGDSGSASNYVNAHPGKKKAVLCFNEEASVFAGSNVRIYQYGSCHDPHELAKNIFSALRELDSGDFDVIFARCPEGEGVEMAVKNRLSKAAGYNFIDV